MIDNNEFGCNMLLKIADFKIDLQNKGKNLDNAFEKYLSVFENADITMHITKEEAEYEKNFSETFQFLGVFAVGSAHRKLAEWLPTQNAFVLHSAVFDVDGTGIALAAHSGTGKTTHMLLWQKLLGERLKIVNGDKPIIRFFDDEPDMPYAYGTPWNGKEHLGCNMRTPLRHIAFIERAEKNSCESMSPSDAINLIFNQVYMPKDSAAVIKTIELINRLISCCSLWKIKCNMEIEAAQIAYNKIMEDKK